MAISVGDLLDGHKGSECAQLVINRPSANTISPGRRSDSLGRRFFDVEHALTVLLGAGGKHWRMPTASTFSSLDLTIEMAPAREGRVRCQAREEPD
jgi:hypothetical protein